MGFHVGYDAKFKRIVLTKRDLKPTQLFLDGWADGSITVSNNSFVQYTVEEPGSKRTPPFKERKLEGSVKARTYTTHLGLAIELE